MMGKGAALAAFGALLCIGTIRAGREVGHGLPEQRLVLMHPRAENTDKCFAALKLVGGILETLAMLGMASGTTCFAATTFIEAISAQNNTEEEWEGILRQVGVSGSCMMMCSQAMMVLHALLATIGSARIAWRSSRVLQQSSAIQFSSEPNIRLRDNRIVQAFQNQARMTRANACGGIFFRNLLIALGQSILFATAFNHLNEIIGIHDSHEDEESHGSEIPLVAAGAALTIGGVLFHLVGNECLPACFSRYTPENPRGGTEPLSWFEWFKSIFFTAPQSPLREELVEYVKNASAGETQALIEASQQGAIICMQELERLQAGSGAYDEAALDGDIQLGDDTTTPRSLLTSLFTQAKAFCDAAVAVITSQIDMDIARRELRGFIARNGIPIFLGHGHSHGGHGHSHSHDSHERDGHRHDAHMHMSARDHFIMSRGTDNPAFEDIPLGRQGDTWV